MSSHYYTKPLIGIFDTTEDKSWKRYENEKGFLQFISPLDGQDFSNNGADVYIRDLPFYNNVELIQVRSFDEYAEPVYHFFLKHDSEYAQLKGSSDTIHEVSSEAELCITIDTIFDYLKFFSLFTVNEDGDAFYIINGQDCEFLKDLSAYEKSRHLRKFNGSVVDDALEMGVYKVATRVLCAGVLYDCQFDVTSDGFVEMTEDDSIGSV
ncbi:MAG: hypothetical protein ACRBDL_09175 [Alphaproteobacteria bacterium]